VRCAAHVVALVMKDAVRLFNVSVRRIREVVKYVLSSPSRKEKFTQCASLAKVDCKKSLILDVLTRWNSTYLMLDASEKYEKVFELLAQIDKDFQERFIFEQIKEFFLPTDADIDEAIASNVVIEDVFEDIKEEEEVDNMEEEVEELDPTSKNKEKMKIKKKKIPRQHAPYQEDWKYARGLVKCLKVFFDATVNFSASTQVTTHMFLWQLLLVRYLTDVVEGGMREIGLPDQFDILSWWQANASRYKILSYMARDILDMPVSSVASESAFSTGKRVLTQ
ncbi:hypothetical protein MKX03_004559, partial [Papaver bracteatum]